MVFESEPGGTFRSVYWDPGRRVGVKNRAGGGGKRGVVRRRREFRRLQVGLAGGIISFRSGRPRADLSLFKSETNRGASSTRASRRPPLFWRAGTSRGVAAVT